MAPPRTNKRVSCLLIIMGLHITQTHAAIIGLFDATVYDGATRTFQLGSLETQDEATLPHSIRILLHTLQPGDAEHMQEVPGILLEWHGLGASKHATLGVSGILSYNIRASADERASRSGCLHRVSHEVCMISSLSG